MTEQDILRLRDLAEAGQVHFKERISSKDDKYEIGCEMVAFSNSRGGRIILLPYTGAGSGVRRALEYDPDAIFSNGVDQREITLSANEFVITIPRKINDQSPSKTDQPQQKTDPVNDQVHEKTDQDQPKTDQVCHQPIGNTDPVQQKTDPVSDLASENTTKLKLSKKQQDIRNYCSIPMADIKKGQRMVSRYYRNRRLGEFLKELSLTEGRNTGIPTIQRELAHNGSPAATFETDEDRLSFLVRIPCHEGEEGISQAFLNDKENVQNDKESDKENQTDTINGTISPNNDTINDTINPDNDTINGLPEIHQRIIEAIRTNPEITRREMIGLLNVSDRTISRALKQLQDQNIIIREGARKNGKWIINNG